MHWPVGRQPLGHENVSHGCISLSPEDAEWYFNNVNVGDPIIVRENSLEVPAAEDGNRVLICWNRSGAPSPMDLVTCAKLNCQRSTTWKPKRLAPGRRKAAQTLSGAAGRPAFGQSSPRPVHSAGQPGILSAHAQTLLGGN